MLLNRCYQSIKSDQNPLAASFGSYSKTMTPYQPGRGSMNSANAGASIDATDQLVDVDRAGRVFVGVRSSGGETFHRRAVHRDVYGYGALTRHVHSCLARCCVTHGGLL